MSSDSGLVRIAHLKGQPQARIHAEVPPNCVKVYVIPRNAYYLVRKDQLLEYKSNKNKRNRTNAPSPNARNDVRSPSGDKTFRVVNRGTEPRLETVERRTNRGPKRVGKNTAPKRTIRDTDQTRLEF